MKRSIRAVVAAFFAAALFNGGGQNASAQLLYDLTHDFVWTPAPAFPPAALEVTGRLFAHAWVQEPGRLVSAVSPLQGAAFDPFGKEVFAVGSLAVVGNPVYNRNHLTKVLNPVVTSIIPITGSGIGREAVVNVLPPVSSARAAVSLDVAPFSLTSPIVGSVHTEGFATPVGARATAYSFGYSSVSIRAGRIVKGKLKWGPSIVTSTNGEAGAAPGIKMADPIYFEAFDRDLNELLFGKLLEIEFTPLAGPAQLQWDSHTGNFQLNAADPTSDAEFFIDLPGTYTDKAGRLKIRIEDGKIVEAEQTGIFAGVALPPVGAPGAFGTQLGELEFDYDIPMRGPNVDVSLLMFDGIHATDVPEPGVLTLLAGVGICGLFQWRKRRRVA